MKTKFILASALLFAASATSAFAEAGWLGNSAVNVNGTWYYCGNYFDWCTGGSFAQDLGDISALYLGGQSQVYESNNQGGGVNWNGGSVEMHYSIDDGDSQIITLDWFKFEPNNNYFQSGGAEFEDTYIDLSGFEAGSAHTIAVWFKCDNQYDNNTVDGVAKNYVAQFTIATPIEIANADDIDAAMDKTDGEPVDVKINGMCLYKDTYWNTLCLPFGLTKVEIETSPLAGADICTLSSASLSEEGMLTLNFAAEEAITAGKPYLVRWNDPDAGVDVEDPIFTGVTLTTSTAGEVNGGDAVLKGTFNPVEYYEEDQYILYLGAENMLYYPSPVLDEPVVIGAFRSYFDLSTVNPNQIKAFKLNFGDDITGIKEISNPAISGSCFTIDGRRLNGMPTTSGLYILNGNKIMIK